MKRVATNYERIRCYVRLFDPDILAVQEVDGESALRRVVDTDVYDVHVDDRPKGSLNGQQSEVTYRQADKAVWDQLSDHYPVLVDLWIR